MKMRCSFNILMSIYCDCFWMNISGISSTLILTAVMFYFIWHHDCKLDVSKLLVVESVQIFTKFSITLTDGVKFLVSMWSAFSCFFRKAFSTLICFHNENRFSRNIWHHTMSVKITKIGDQFRRSNLTLIWKLLHAEN